MLRLRLSTLVVGSTVLAACGSEAAGPTGRDLRGTWTYSASGISSGVPPVCTVSGVTVTIAAHISTGFSGTHTSGLIPCGGGGMNDTFALGTGLVINGVASGDSVRFNFFGAADFRHNGTVRADTMSGVLNLTILVSGTPTAATGTWRLVKQ